MKEYLQFCNEFSTWETEKKLFDFRMNGIKIWQFVRDNIIWMTYDMLNEGVELGAYRLEPREDKGNLLHEAIQNRKLVNPLIFKRCEVLVIPRSRRVKVRNYDVSPYVDGAFDKIPYTYTVLENRKSEDRNINTLTESIQFYDPSTMYKSMELNEKQLKNIKKIIAFIQKRFQIKFNQEQNNRIITIFSTALASRKPLRRYYKLMLLQMRPKVILFSGQQGSFESKVLIELAREENIKTIGVIDGIIDVRVFANVFQVEEPESGSIMAAKLMKSFPENMFLWININEGLMGKHIFEVGNAFHNMRISECKMSKNTENKRKKIMIISDYTAESGLDRFAKNIAECLPNDKYLVQFKLHPSDANWRYKYPSLLNSKVQVVGIDERRDIYEWVKDVDYVVGTLSTALYEVASFNLKIFILKKGNYKISDYLCRKNKAIWIEDEDDLCNLLTETGTRDNDENIEDFWPKDVAGLYSRALKEIIEN